MAAKGPLMREKRLLELEQDCDREKDSVGADHPPMQRIKATFKRFVTLEGRTILADGPLTRRAAFRPWRRSPQQGAAPGAKADG